MPEFEQTLSAGTLISIAVGAVALLLLLIIKFRVHAFVALILVSFLTALVTGKEVGSAGRNIGGRPFIAKPVDPERIIELIEKHVKN